MANLTVVIEDELLRRARIRALEQGTSVNALLREYLQSYAGRTRADSAMTALLEMSSSADTGSGPTGRTWTRDDVYER